VKKPNGLVLTKLRLLNDLMSALGADTRKSLERFLPLIESLGKGEAREFREAVFWLKATIRAFFAQVEGISYALRYATLEAADRGHLNLTLKEKSQLSGRKINKATGTLGDLIKGGQAADRLKLAFKYFPRVFGSGWQPDLGTRGFSEYRELQSIRNAITHPTTLESLFPIEAGKYLVPAIDWFGSQFAAMLVDISTRQGRPGHSGWAPMDLEPFRKLEIEKLPVAQDFYEEIAKSKRKDLTLTRAIFFELGRDTEIASRFHREANLSASSIERSPLVQFASRLYVRTIFTEIEALASRAATMLLNSAQRSATVLSDEEKHKLESIEIVGRAAVVTKLFPQHFGDHPAAGIDDRAWFAFREIARFRDRIVHPDSAEKLILKAGTFRCLIDLHDWYRQFIIALEIGAKWEKLAELDVDS
jgi:hypothetical protein